ncbi:MULTISPECIES: hypothetical protein [Streptomyces]|uniref:Uncharacterized protein n=1 Tax=Streptomyces yunnanensis TaxID=156453 RepID=A0A9X8QZS7_9ACTN|nr:MULTISPECIES: hypothetical protein [Streptomyces]SHN26655.1 hypothetical protein SAMN05216268_1283 [Streptomyces yunnanensis]
MARRLTVTALLALIGAAALVLSAFQPWYQGRDPRSVPVAELFTGLTDKGGAATATSMLLPLAAAGALALLALAVRSKAAMALAALVGLATCVLWVVQQIRELAPIAFDWTAIEPGLRNAAGGVLLLLIAVAVLPTRER